MSDYGIHIFSARKQPATRYLLDVLDKPRWVKIAPHAKVWTDCCRKLRIAKNCVVQVYYDKVPYWCKDGKGCKAKP